MDSAMHRHDISEHVWSLLEPLLPGRKGVWGGKAKDNRLFINAVFGIFLRNTETGKIPIGDSVVGVTREHGKIFFHV